MLLDILFILSVLAAQVRSLQALTVRGRIQGRAGQPDEGVVSVKLLSDQFLAPGTSVTGKVAGKIFKGVVTQAPNLQVAPCASTVFFPLLPMAACTNSSLPTKLRCISAEDLRASIVIGVASLQPRSRFPSFFNFAGPP